MSIQIVKRNVKPSDEQIKQYTAGITTVTRRDNNLRFGRIVACTDADHDG